MWLKNSNDVFRKLLELNLPKVERRFKEAERLVEPKVEPPIAIRLDGVGFGKRLAGFEWPRDYRVHRALLEAGYKLLDALNALIVYVGSDEINVIVCSEIPYSGRVEKLTSITAGIASAVVSTKLGRILYFDSRVIPLASCEEAALYVMYRARVVLNNFVNSLLKWLGYDISRWDVGLQERVKVLTERGYKLDNEVWKALGTCIARFESTKRLHRGGTVLEVARRRVVAVDGITVCLRRILGSEGL